MWDTGVLTGMFRATFLGHQGWLCSTKHTSIMIDPLLTADFGHGGHLGRVYPPRELDVARFPPIDAVVITHEHDDHFDVPSLHRLEREIPIYLSARSSPAAHALLADMGFGVRTFHADAQLEIGDFRYHTFCVDHSSGAGGDEWDAFPFVLHDTQRHGCLASSVDVQPSAAMLARLGELGAKGLWCVANNTTSYASTNLTHRTNVRSDNEAASRVAASRYRKLLEQWGPPLATLMCGGGWSFPSERAAMNHSVFTVDSEHVCKTLSTWWPEHLFAAVRPGDTFTMESGKLVGRGPSQDFLATLPATRWPPREFTGHKDALPQLEPLCPSALEPTSLVDALLEELGDFASYLYDSRVFRACISTAHQDVMCFSLRVDHRDERVTLRYAPSKCAFVLHESVHPHERFWSGLECWASDLLALLRGDIGPSALCYSGRMRSWNNNPEHLRVSPWLLWHFSHPLRRPRVASRLYTALREALVDTTHRVPARKAK